MKNNYTKLEVPEVPYSYCSSCNGDITTKNDIGAENGIWILCELCKDQGIAHVPSDYGQVWERLEVFGVEGDLDSIRERVEDLKKDYLGNGEYEELKVKKYSDYYDEPKQLYVYGLKTVKKGGTK